MPDTSPHPRRGTTMTRSARLAWLLALLAAQMLYFPINRIVKGGVVLSTPWDAWVPFWPVWIVPYLLSIVWWLVCFVWAAWKMEGARYQALVLGSIAVMLSAYAFYLLYPTCVERPVLDGHGWQMELTRLLYNHDRLYNAFPSSHTYTTMLITFFWWDWRPRLRWLWAGIAVVVLLSTLFTGQHNLPDPIGGIVWAWAGYRLGTWWVTRKAGAGL